MQVENHNLFFSFSFFLYYLNEWVIQHDTTHKHVNSCVMLVIGYFFVYSLTAIYQRKKNLMYNLVDISITNIPQKKRLIVF